MKKALLLAAVAALALSCNGQAANRKTKDNTEKENTMKTIHLTTDEFSKKIADLKSAEGGEWKYLGDKPALIDFYADWCGPCKMIAPVLEELAEEYAGQIYIYKVDTEKEQELAAAFGIRSIPSLLFIPMDGQPQMARGAMPKDAFKEIIDEVLLGKKPSQKE